MKYDGCKRANEFSMDVHKTLFITFYYVVGPPSLPLCKKWFSWSDLCAQRVVQEVVSILFVPYHPGPQEQEEEEEEEERGQIKLEVVYCPRSLKREKGGGGDGQETS